MKMLNVLKYMFVNYVRSLLNIQPAQKENTQLTLPWGIQNSKVSVSLVGNIVSFLEDLGEQGHNQDPRPASEMNPRTTEQCHLAAGYLYP